MSLEKFENKSIEKLIETVSAGIGVKYSVKIAQRKTNPETHSLDDIEKIKAEGVLIQNDSENEIFDKIKHRLVHQEVNRQLNLDNIVEKSADFLSEKNVSEQPVDEDWRAKYFNKAQDISSDEMQNIWAKILSNEVTTPGTISLRTLEIVSNLSKNEARVFERAAGISFLGGHILKTSTANAFDDFGINYNDLLLLRAAGLIFDSDTLNITFSKIPQLGCGIITFGKKFISVKKENTEKYVFNQVAFTPAGSELMTTLQIEPNYNYLEKFIEEKTKEGFIFEDLKIQKQ